MESVTKIYFLHQHQPGTFLGCLHGIFECGALVYFVLASFVTVDANTEEKGLFIGRKCLACGCRLHTAIPVFFVTLAARSLQRPDSGHATPCQDNWLPMCSCKGGRSSATSVLTKFLIMQCRIQMVGHDNVP